jgi:hypothetical protein
MTCEYLREFKKKIETARMVYSGAWRKLIHEKNKKSKISWQCPFKCFHSTSTISYPQSLTYQCLVLRDLDFKKGFHHASSSPLAVSEISKKKFSPAGPGFLKALLINFYYRYLPALVPGMLMFSPAPPIQTQPSGNCFQNAKSIKEYSLLL